MQTDPLNKCNLSQIDDDSDDDDVDDDYDDDDIDDDYDIFLPLAAESIELTPVMSKRRRRSFNGNSNSHLDSEHKRVERSLVGVGGWPVSTQAPNTDPLEIKLMILGYQIGMV